MKEEILDHKEISDQINVPLLKKRTIVQKIKDFIVDNASKY